MWKLITLFDMNFIMFYLRIFDHSDLIEEIVLKSDKL